MLLTEFPPWIQSCHQKYNLKLVDVKVTEIPKNLTVIPVFDLLMKGEIKLEIYQYDRNEYFGWENPFFLRLEFPESRYYEVEVPASFQIVDYHTVKVPISEDTIVRERQITPRRIPQIIWNISAPPQKQASSIVRSSLQLVRNITVRLQSSSLYFVLDDEASMKEVENSGLEGFLEAYNSVRSGSYKADLMRYWLLYKYGGIYHDDKTVIREPLDNEEMFLQSDLFAGTHRTPEIAFLGSRKNSPIMIEVLKKSIENIIQRQYTKHRLGITGNFVFTSVMESKNDDIFGKQGIWRKYWGENVAILPITLANNKIIIDNKVIWEKSVIPNCDWPKGKTHYTNLWTERQVFVDGNPELSMTEKILSWKHLGTTTAIVCLIVSLLILGQMIKYNAQNSDVRVSSTKIKRF